MVQRVQVDVSEELAGQVPDGQPAIGRCPTEGLVQGKVAPVFFRASVYGVFEWVVIDKRGLSWSSSRLRRFCFMQIPLQVEKRLGGFLFYESPLGC